MVPKVLHGWLLQCRPETEVSKPQGIIQKLKTKQNKAKQNKTLPCVYIISPNCIVFFKTNIVIISIHKSKKNTGEKSG